MRSPLSAVQGLAITLLLFAGVLAFCAVVFVDTYSIPVWFAVVITMCISAIAGIVLLVEHTGHGPEDVDPDYYCRCGKPWLQHSEWQIRRYAKGGSDGQGATQGAVARSPDE